MIKIKIDIPKAMLRVAQEEDIKERPYDLCLECPFIKESCDGPNVLAMTNERWVEWANKRAKILKYTRTKIAEESGIPVGTVSSVMSGRVHDLRHSTMRAITHVLIGGCWGQYPCHIAARLLDGNLEEDTDNDIDLLTEKLESAQKALEKSESDSQKKINYLKDQIAQYAKLLDKKDKQSFWLLISIGILMLLIICILIFDISTPGIGYFRF